jgi:hypothetical protein
MSMSGSIQCHSPSGFGSTFTLRLPVWPRENSGPEVPAIKPSDISNVVDLRESLLRFESRN